ncbi:MAG: PAS domain S-box protein, partial [Syntrophaceae bacterium]
RLCKDGSIGYHTFSASPVFSDHEVIGLEGFLTDVTENKKTLDALRASEGRFRSIFDNSLDAIQLGLPTGEIVSANRAAQSLLGMTEEEICRAGRAGIFVQDEALARAIEEREKKGKWRGTLTFRRMDGSTFPADVSSNVFGTPEGGTRTITIFSDVSERKQMQEALRESELFLKETQLIARLGGWKANPHTDYLEWSDGVYSIIEAPRDYAPGFAEGLKYYPPEYAPILRDNLSDCLETGAPFRVELQMITDTGKRRWSEVRGLAPVIEGERSYVVGTLQDITERKEAELALRDSEERFRLFMDNSPTIAWIKDEQGRHVYLSKTYEDRFGVRSENWIGKTDAELWPPEIAENFRKNDLAVLAAGHPIEFTEQTVNPDGSHVHWLNSKFPFRADGILYVAGIGLDITERIRLEKELRLSEQKYRSIFDNVPIGIFQSSLEGRYISANVQAARNLGYDSPEELISTITDIGTQVYRNSEDRREITRLLKEQGHAENFEAQFIRKDGSTVWGSLNAKTVRDERGEILYYEGTSQDINARKLAEASLRESERRYHDMLSNVKLLSVTLDREGRVTFCNDYLLQLTGWRREEILGSNWFDLFIPPEQDEDLRRAFVELLNDALPVAWHRENEILTRSGERRFIRWNNTVLHSISGDAIGTASIGEDITDRKKAEEELATHREHLEELVKERTRELEDKTLILEELNAATRALLRQREEDRKELEERFVANMKNLILPYAEKMKKTHLDERQQSYLGIMEAHFNEIMSPLMKTMQQRNFTPTESQVASLIKDGKTTKEIAAIMGVAPSSIDTHRKSIRRKLGLNNMKANLQSHLQSIGI